MAIKNSISIIVFRESTKIKITTYILLFKNSTINSISTLKVLNSCFLSIIYYFRRVFYLHYIFFCPDDDGVAKCVYTSKDLLSAHNIVVKACMSMWIGLYRYQNYIFCRWSGLSKINGDGLCQFGFKEEYIYLRLSLKTIVLEIYRFILY